MAEPTHRSAGLDRLLDQLVEITTYPCAAAQCAGLYAVLARYGRQRAAVIYGERDDPKGSVIIPGRTSTRSGRRTLPGP